MRERYTPEERERMLEDARRELEEEDRRAGSGLSSAGAAGRFGRRAAATERPGGR